MALTLSDAWRTAMRSGAKPVYWLQIDLGNGDVRNALLGWSSDPTLSAYPSSIDSITPVSSSIDPISRSSQVPSCSVTFADDGWARDLVVAHRLKGKAVTIKVGERDLQAANYAPFFAGIIAQAPKQDSGGRMVMKCAGAQLLLSETSIKGYWPGVHPLEAMVDIFEKVGVPASLYNATAFDPSQSRYAEVSHFVVQRGAGWASYHADQAVTTPTRAIDLIDELASLLNGAVVVREDGKLDFIFANPTTSIVDTLTEDDISDFEVESLDANLLNRVSVAWYRDADGQTLLQHVENDSDSQSAHAYPGGQPNVVSQEFETHWCEGSAGGGVPMTETVPGPGDSLTLGGTGVLFGMCGTRWPGFPDGPQPSWAKLSSQRPMYLRMGGLYEDSDSREIFKVTAPLNISTSQRWVRHVRDPFDDSVSELTRPITATATLAERGALGTTPQVHTLSQSGDNVWYDCTMAVWKARDLLRRFSNGAPVIKMRVPVWRGYHLQLGDLVGVAYARFWAHGKDGLTANTKWEVIGKDPIFVGDEPHVELTLCWVTDAAPPSPTYVAAPTVGTRMDTGRAMDISVSSEMSSRPFVAGFEITAGLGRVVNIASGTYSIGGSVVLAKKATTLSMRLLRDNYIYIDIRTGGFVVNAITIGDPEPSAQQFLTKLGKVTTDLSTIVSINDQRVRTGIKGGAIVEESVTSPSLAAGAVTTKAIAQRAVSGQQIAVGDKKTATLRNSSFSLWSRG